MENLPAQKVATNLHESGYSEQGLKLLKGTTDYTDHTDL